MPALILTTLLLHHAVALRLGDGLQDAKTASLPTAFDDVAWWDGVDVGESAQAPIESTAEVRMPRAPERAEPRANVSIFGMFNSGTNLAQTVLSNAYPALSVCPETSQSRWRGEWSCLHTQISKHANPSRVKEWIQTENKAEEQRFVFLVRNPFSVLEATVRHPYDLKRCVRGLGLDWLQRPCKCAEIVGPEHEVFCARQQENFTSAVEMWNVFTQGYVDLVQDLGKEHAVLVTYEELVKNPRKFLKDSAVMLAADLRKLPVDEAISSMGGPAKQNGVGRDLAVAKIDAESYLEAFREPARSLLCAALSRTLMKRLGYDKDCLGH